MGYKVTETYNVGVNPTALAVTPNGKYVYVANNNNYAIPGSDSVTVLDTEEEVVKTTINDSSFNEPYAVAISKDGKKAYVCNSGGSTISIINSKTNTVSGVITGFDGPSGIA